MNISKILNRACSTVCLLIVLFFVASSTMAQTDSTPKKRLTSPATVKGLVGGESHDSYAIRAQKGQTLIVQISWVRKDDNRAEFTISRSANFFNAESVKVGKESNNGKTWSGKISTTGNYYIYVVAHPSAKYTLKVTAR